MFHFHCDSNKSRATIKINLDGDLNESIGCRLTLFYFAIRCLLGNMASLCTI